MRQELWIRVYAAATGSPNNLNYCHRKDIADQSLTDFDFSFPEPVEPCVQDQDRERLIEAMKGSTPKDLEDKPPKI